MRFPLSLATLGLIFFLSPAPGLYAQDLIREIETTADSDYFGHDLRAERDVSLEECKQACIGDAACKAFTYNTSASFCFLKSDFGELSPFAGAIAGRIVESERPADIGAAPALAFLPGDIAADAGALRREAIELARREGPGEPAIYLDRAITALGSGDAEGAERLFKIAAGLDPQKARNWFDTALTALQQPGNDWRIRRIALHSAVNAYLLTRTRDARAGALGAMARALELQGRYRPALSAYEESLELVESARLRDAYSSLRSREGFRVIGNTVDSDAALARACVQFSEPLVRSGVDYSQYVTVDGRGDAPIEAEERQICATGLEHGRNYRITLRSGLPSTVGESLESPVEIDAYIRDRAPSVRFSGENFVLPLQARQAIPVYGVNADAAKIRIFRIGERGLARLISGNGFLSQLGGYELEEIEQDLGQPVWEGSLDLERERNREIATSFPIGEAIRAREPGIYVMTAEPEGVATEFWTARATQWFLVSDLGLTTHAGNDGLTVFVRSLDTARAVPDVELALIARNNEVLANARSDANGRARFDPGLMRGTAGRTPAILTARLDGESGDFVFLDLTRAGFDLSDRGVEGRAAPGPVDVYSWTDRGIYRPGDAVHAVALARDDTANAIADLPLTVTFRRPDGVVASRTVSANPRTGGHASRYELPGNAMHGVWKVEIHTDPERDPLGENLFLVEDFVPDRIEFDLEPSTEIMQPDLPLTITVDGRYLYGAPANDLALEGELRLHPVRELAVHRGYLFGLADESADFGSLRPLVGLPRTGSDGRTEFEVLAGSLPESSRPIAAEIIVRMREDGGRAVERRVSVPVHDQRSRIGIRPLFDGTVREGSQASFQLIGIDGAGDTAALSGLEWSLHRIERNYQWYRDGYSWRYEAVDISRLVSQGSVDIGTDSPASLAMPVEWGRYRLEVESGTPDGPVSSVEFNAGYFAVGNPAETPDVLEIALDRDVYLAGEIATMRIEADEAGILLVTVGTDRLQEVFERELEPGSNEIEIPVSASWGAGAYVTATLLRPGSQTQSRAPARSIGTAWLQIDSAPQRLAVALELPDKIRPAQPLRLPVKVSGQGDGESVHVTIAAVDVGILNLTDYEAPDPEGWYFGQRRMGLEIRDVYGRLIDSRAGVTGRVRSGGDGPAMAANGKPPEEELLALFSGIIQLDADGEGEIEFDIPPFNGSARFMAVAWTATKVGNMTREAIIRDPVVLQASLPRIMAPGDRAEALLEIANVDAMAGEFELEIAGRGAVLTSDLSQTLTLADGERKTLALSLQAAQTGTGEIFVELRRDGAAVASRLQTVEVRPATLPIARRVELELAAANGSITLDRQLLADSLPNSASVSLQVSQSAGFDVSSLLMNLDRYPYGCVEQTTSRALPLLYLSDFNLPPELLERQKTDTRIAEAITRILSFQSASGSFGLWAPDDGEFWLDAYVTDFLTRAAEQGHAVPVTALRLATTNLQNKLGYLNDLAENGDAVAYALYVLARNRKASAGDLRYYADTRLAEFTSPLALAQLAAALTLYNELDRGRLVFDEALARARESDNSRRFARADFGSPLRDGAAILALATESRPAGPRIAEMIELVQERIASRQTNSTQENAWMVLAARAVQEGDAALRLEVDGRPHSGPLALRVEGEALASQSIVVRNRTGEPVRAALTSLAAPRDPLPPGGEGFSITRSFFRMDGEADSLIEAVQNTRYVVVLEIEEFNQANSRVLVSDLLPGGFEIDNPRIVDSASLENFPWLGEITPAHLEFRDDRFVAAFDRTPNSPRSITLAYVVRAVTPGRYVLPAANVEDMYRPELNARTASGLVEIRAAR